MVANAALKTLVDGWDGGDPWGSAMSAGFALCEVAYAADVREVCAILDYSPGMALPLDFEAIDAVEDTTTENDALPDSIETYQLATAWTHGYITADDMVRAARILDRYIDACKRAGRDY